ncbi:hypothetical protein [Nostoc linckia]|nr:hypothetical protein [Nostoc linckia]
MAQMRQRELVEAYHAAAPVASVGMAICFLKGVKDPDPNWFNPYQQKLLSQNATQTIPQPAAQTFLDLARDRLLPTWVAPLVDLDLIKAAASA